MARTSKRRTQRGERASALTLVLDQASGSLRLSEKEDRVVGVSLLPDAAALLTDAERTGQTVRLLLPGSQAAMAEGLGELLPIEAAWAAGLPEDLPPPLVRDEVFVSADPVYREAAAALGYRPLPHPAMARSGADALAWRYAALLGPRELFERIEVVPYDLERRTDGEWRLLGAIRLTEARRAESLGLRVQRLDADVGLDDLFLVPIDREAGVGWAEHPVLWRDRDRALIALLGQSTIDELPVHGAHGHAVALLPDPGLLDPPAPPAEDRGELVAGRWLASGAKVLVEVADRPFRPNVKVLTPACPTSAAAFQDAINRLSGAAPLDAAGTIASRHTAHPDNLRVVDALVAELRLIGYCAWREPFSWYGQTRYNVIADLPAAGAWQIRPDILERLARILVRHPRPDPPEPWLRAIRRLEGRRSTDGEGLVEDELTDEVPAWVLRRKLEWRLGLGSWWPWWRLCLRATIPASLVIVGCHLDSTGGNDAGYVGATSPARGADDDGSGVAGTLALARWMWSMRGQLWHTVRFCFFNSEEQGLIGSKAYATALKAYGAPIKAAVCMDMIGYNSDANRIFEVHAGYTDPAVRDASVPIANIVASWAACLGSLPPAQVYQGTSPYGGPDRLVSDGAINRSDHAAFHQQGYPAVVVTEDFFGNLASEPMADPNPNYHRNADSVVDAAYAADIICAVGHAVRALAS